MARFRGFAVVGALALGMVGCLYQPYEPSKSAQTPTSPEPSSTAPAAAHVEPAPTTSTAPRGEPLVVPSIERWRPAVENYVPSVTPEDQVRLNGSFRPFATYLNDVHAHIHPIFADRFLADLDLLPASDPMNRVGLPVKLEIVLESLEGRIQRMGVTASSGVTAFDVMALEAADQAQPFGPPPREIVSPDGLVYFHWEFHRGKEACGTWNARPFLLKSAPTAGAAAPLPRDCVEGSPC